MRSTADLSMLIQYQVKSHSINATIETVWSELVRDKISMYDEWMFITLVRSRSNIVNNILFTYTGLLLGGAIYRICGKGFGQAAGQYPPITCVPGTSL